MKFLVLLSTLFFAAPTFAQVIDDDDSPPAPAIDVMKPANKIAEFNGVYLCTSGHYEGYQLTFSQDEAGSVTVVDAGTKKVFTKNVIGVRTDGDQIDHYITRQRMMNLLLEVIRTKPHGDDRVDLYTAYPEKVTYAKKKSDLLIKITGAKDPERNGSSLCKKIK